MSWFKRDSPLRSSLSRRLSSFSPPPRLDEGACLEVFRTHWQQAWNAMEKNGQQSRNSVVDDVTSVVNHLDQMVTLLLQEAQQYQGSSDGPRENKEITGPILDYMLMEGCLDKLFSWSIHCGEYVNVMKLEQLKLYEVLVTNCHRDLLFHRPVVRPLLRLLASCGDCSPVEVEKRLIILLNTLCVCLTQFPDLLQVFFGASSDHGSTRSENPRDMFLIFSLLIPFVHREGAIGQQARDALLLCMSLSRKNESIGVYIAEHSNFCPVLATGLSGLYSLLHRKLPVAAEDWHHFTPEDISGMPELSMFLNSLEFCNAVIQVAHPLVQEQLLEYLYQGFLIPVLGPALHQDAAGVPVGRLENTSKYLNTVEEIIATTAYLELFLRTITEPMLLQVFLKFILTSAYEGHFILNTLIDRLGAQSRLCLVTMALFRKLLDLNCEHIMFELVFKYLIPCSHVMVSQRSRLRDIDIYSHSADKFLSLIPSSCIPDVPCYPSSPNKPSLVSSGSHPIGMREMCNSITNEKNLRGGSLRLKRHHRSPSTASFAFGEYDRMHSTFYTDNIHSVGLEMFQTNYMEYLMDAHNNIRACTLACSNWSAPYDGLIPPPDFCKNLLQIKESSYSSVNNSVITNGYYSSASNNRTANVSDDGQKTNLILSQIQQSNVGFSQNNASNPCNFLNNIEVVSRKNLQNSGDFPMQNANVTLSLTCSSDHESMDLAEEALGTFINGCFLEQLINAEDDTVFWNLVDAIRTPLPYSDFEENCKFIDFYVNELLENNIGENTSLDNHCTNEIFEVGDESSNVDSGVFESRESNCSSDKDYDPSSVTVNCAKSIFHEESNKVVVNAVVSSKSDVKLCFSGTSECSSKSSNSPVSPNSWESFGSPDIGPFLSILLTRLEMMMQNDVYTNLHLTGLLARLAWYPQPLLRSFLLNHSLVFQPTVRSLLQVLGSLMHKVDSYSCTVDNYEELLVKGRQFLSSREEHLLLNGPPRVYSDVSSKVRGNSAQEIQRGEPRRRSLTSYIFRRGNILKGKDRGVRKEPALESISDGQGYRYVSKPTPDALEGEMESVKTKNAVLCAVVLEEFLKELASIAQEHSIVQLDPDFWDKRWQLYD